MPPVEQVQMWNFLVTKFPVSGVMTKQKWLGMTARPQRIFFLPVQSVTVALRIIVWRPRIFFFRFRYYLMCFSSLSMTDSLCWTQYQNTEDSICLKKQNKKQWNKIKNINLSQFIFIIQNCLLFNIFCGTFLFWHFWFTIVVHLCRMTTSNIFKTEKRSKTRRHIHVFIVEVVIIIELFDSKHAIWM